jgi:hypothetical protein
VKREVAFDVDQIPGGQRQASSSSTSDPDQALARDARERELADEPGKSASAS